MHLNLDDLAARLMEQLRATEHQFIGLQAQLALINQLREEARRVAATTADPADPVDGNRETTPTDRPDANRAQGDARANNAADRNAHSA